MKKVYLYIREGWKLVLQQTAVNSSHFVYVDDLATWGFKQ